MAAQSLQTCLQRAGARMMEPLFLLGAGFNLDANDLKELKTYSPRREVGLYHEGCETWEQSYYEAVYEKALERVRASERLIAIGYSFAPSDAPSYDRFLKDLFSRSGTLLVVAPPAQAIAERLREEYKEYSPAIEYLPMTFSEWGHAGFPKGHTES